MCCVCHDTPDSKPLSTLWTTHKLELINGKVIPKAIYRYCMSHAWCESCENDIPTYMLYEGNIRAEMSILSSLILQSLWWISVKRINSTSYFTTNVNPNKHYIQAAVHSSIHYWLPYIKVKHWTSHYHRAFAYICTTRYIQPVDFGEYGISCRSFRYTQVLFHILAVFWTRQKQQQQQLLRIRSFILCMDALFVVDFGRGGNGRKHVMLWFLFACFDLSE